MEKINVTTVSGVAASATAVPVVVPEFQKAKAVIRRFSALGNDAACAVKFYVPKVSRSFLLIEALAAAGTAVKIPVDVAAGHVFKGHTLASSDLLLLLTPGGWKVASATYADVTGQMYCTATITAGTSAVRVETARAMTECSPARTRWNQARARTAADVVVVRGARELHTISPVADMRYRAM